MMNIARSIVISIILSGVIDLSCFFIGIPLSMAAALLICIGSFSFASYWVHSWDAP